MDGGRRRRRARTELGLSVTTAVLAVLTLVWPEWIEALLGVEPDSGSGAAEWAIVVGLLLLTVVFGVLARSGMRQAARAATRPEGRS